MNWKDIFLLPFNIARKRTEKTAGVVFIGKCAKSLGVNFKKSKNKGGKDTDKNTGL